MTAFTNLNDEDAFPPWMHLPDHGNRSPYYYSPSGTPKRHWCLLGEIQSFDPFIRYRTIIKDADDSRMVVAFYLDNYDAFDFSSKLKEGHTLAIMYAQQHTFLDGTFGVRVEEVDHFRVS